jgi:ribonucleotide monophosphatase NagD (HAD superfamily)
MRKLFDQIYIESTKNKEILEKVKNMVLENLSTIQLSQETLFILIGDSLKRDIKIGNQVGFITIYKPSPFMGQENPQSSDEKPHYTIQTLKELPALLNNLGLPIGS